MRRPAIALLTLIAPAACGLAFSPGDYRESTEAEAGSSIDSSPGGPETSSPIIDAGGNDAGPAPTRIALFAGRRDSLPGEAAGQLTIAETMLTSIASDGALGPITFDSPSAAALWTHAALLEGQIYLQTATAIAHAPFTDHIGGPWITAAIPAPPAPGIKGWAIDSHALLSGAPFEPLNGDDRSAWTAAFVDGGVSEWAVLTAQTIVARGNTRLVRGGNHVYIVGGAPASTGTVVGLAAVEVATLESNGALSSFHATANLPVADDSGAPIATFDPIAVASADHVYLLGGLPSSASSTATDFVFAAKVKDAATGDLDPWVVLPRLPQPMSGFAAIVTPSWLVVFGGELTGNKTTAAVVRLAIHADGTFGTSWETAGQLPGGRSAIVGVTY